MSNLAIYLVGYVLIIGGLGYGAYRLDVPPLWIGVGAIVMIGIGIVTGVAKTRRRESSSAT